MSSTIFVAPVNPPHLPLCVLAVSQHEYRLRGGSLGGGGQRTREYHRCRAQWQFVVGAIHARRDRAGVQVYARGQKETKKRTVASLAVSRSQLGEVQRAVEKGNQRGRSTTVLDHAARPYLQELLAAEAGTRYVLLVHNDCLFTLKTGLIDVRHLLSVRL